MKRFIKFCSVGGSGFLFDAAVFWLLLQLGLEATLARIMAFWSAVIFTWFGHRVLTFAIVNNRVWSQLFKYFFTAHIAGAANLATFVLVGSPIYAAFIIGIVVGTVFNYLLASRFVFVNRFS